MLFAARSLVATPTRPPLSFTFLPNLLNGDNDPCLQGYYEKQTGQYAPKPSRLRRPVQMSPCLSSPGPWHQPQDIPSHLLLLHLISLLSEFLQTTSPLSFFLPVFSSCHQAPGQALTFPGLTPSYFSMSAFSEYSLIATQRPFRLKPSPHVEEHANPGEDHPWQKKKLQLQFTVL